MGRYNASGLPQVEYRVSVGEFVRGANWVRSSGQINVPVNTVDVYIPEACEIRQAVILTEGGPGSCVIDIWKDSYSNFPPVDADSITGGNEPEISGGDKYSDPTLSGWTTTIAAGDVLRFNLDSSNTFTRVSIYLVLRKL